MSLQSSLGNISSAIGNDISGAINTISSKLNGILGNAKTQITSIWDGGFVGIDAKNAPMIAAALEKYISTIQDTLDRFNQITDIDRALKGASAEAAKEFLDAIKELMNAYVTQMRQDSKDLQEVIASYEQGSQDIARQVSQNAQDIRSEAEQIHLD